MKFQFYLLLPAFLLAACSPASPDCARPEVICAGLVTDTGSLNDYGITQSTWDGIQLALAEGQLHKADLIESVDARDYAKNLAYFAERDYDIILTAGAGLRDETLQAADLYPDSVFIGVDQLPDLSRPNFTAITFPEDQGGYLAGALAARMTHTGKVGAVCETAGIPAVWRACEGFRAGVRSVDPAITAFISYRENGSRDKIFIDSAWGYQTATGLIGQGVDVVFGVGGGTGQGALLAASDLDVYAIGSEQDQFHVMLDARHILLTSVLPVAAGRVRLLIQLIPQSGQAISQTGGLMELAPYHALEGQVPDDVERMVLELSRQLSGGEITTDVPAEQP